MDKKIYNYKEIKPSIIEAIDLITNPIKQTMSPNGGNVIYENEMGDQFVTNDGVTIAKNINVKDPVQNAIIEIIKSSALKTNVEAGDGTSSTILLSSILTKGGLDLIDKGENQMKIRDNFIQFGKDIKKYLKKQAIEIKTDEDLFNIARISANGDKEIADNVVKTMKIVGEEGQVLINPSFSDETELVEDTGFIGQKIFSTELLTENGTVQYMDIPVLVTDKRLYYKQETQTILKTIIDSGYKSVAIVAADFIGESLPYFVANHLKNDINILLIKEDRPEILQDLASYLGGEVVSDKKGSIVNKITIDNFLMAKMIFADTRKSIISRDKEEKNKLLDTRVKLIKKDMKDIGNKKDSEYNKLKDRLASLTRGMVTIKVGGATQLETIERIFRYEDAINATRSAMSDGYVVGGGLSLKQAYSDSIDTNNSDYNRLYKEVCYANLSQIAENSGIVPEMCIQTLEGAKKNIGFNASNYKYEDLLEAGIIEPVRVLNQVIDNSISIANVIITSRYLIVNNIEEE